ncbi:MAG: S53 family peptidase [Rhodanobacter sp.]|jgi:subtilase family serine protease|nr:S53 family peptidase [Rhodanobacter sp.]
MHAKFPRKALAASLTLLFAGFTTVAMATGQQAATDMGLAPSAQPIHVTLMLKLHNQAALERFIQQTTTQGSANFQKFLSTDQFARTYGATDTEIAHVQAFLKAQGIDSKILANHLAIQTSGTMSQFSRMFQTSIHEYATPKTGRRFHRPAGSLLLPAVIANTVAFATGLSNERQYLSHRVSVPRLPGSQMKLAPAVNALNTNAKAGGNPSASGQPGNYTVGDVADFYHINPLYKHGVTGEGSTIGIVTLSDFFPADAQTYWDAIGLTTKPNRITQIHVDGGAAIDGGSGETALDVEQSGGIAPAADILVYDAPNSGNGFTDAFLQAVSDNQADSISTSWGLPEIFNFAALNINGASNKDTSDAGDLRAFDQIFMEAAAQGQSVFVASGDSGAYDTARSLGAGSGPGEFSAPLTVDSPASDPYVTAAGGTTRPFSFSFGAGNPTASIDKESVWGWGYLQTYFDTNFGPGVVDLFSVGGGGGVSVYWKQPWYQRITWGTRRSEKRQSLVYNDPQAGPTTLLKLPGNFRGRNVPDISLNADPETGYAMYSSTDGGWGSSGGTSFVAPQLNGISALLTQSSRHRIGFWNPHVYLLHAIFGSGRYTAFRDIRTGDDWFYDGEPGYDPGAGIGTLNVANFDLFLRSGF